MSDSPPYAGVVLTAMENIKRGIGPVESYELAAKEYTTKESVQNKGCPKSAFLRLCQDGYVKGVARGNYTTSKASKSYAVDAARILISDPTLGRLDNEGLWDELEKVNARARKRLNDSQGEMIVVRTLWGNGHINS